LADREDRKWVAGLLLTAGSVGIHFALCTFAGFAIGYGLDEYFGVWYLKFVFLVFGIASGFAELLRIVKKSEEKDDAGTSAGDGSKDH
jgi:F0F1-type ATP synthase assembly protein I